MSNLANAKEAAEAAENQNNVCANCGTKGGDIQFKKCAACELVRYCSVQCQREHRPRHKKACKKRVKELHDKELFGQPDGTHDGDCPICFLPLPIDPSKAMFWSCCSSVICSGCVVAKTAANLHDETKARTCPFCRELAVEKEEQRKRMMKRIKANDPVALKEMGRKCYIDGNHGGALEYYSKAVELGNIDAHYRLGRMYMKGEGGVEKDEKKTIQLFEKASIGGHPEARYNLAVIEGKNRNFDRSTKHSIIAANLGHEDAMKLLWEYFSNGFITKEDLDATLRSHKAALDAMKSEQRDMAAYWEQEYLNK